MTGWLTTVVARVCLDTLRSRKTRREASLDGGLPEPTLSRGGGMEPKHEMLLADSVGLALLVVLDKLGPAERLAFVLHDMFDLPFEEIAPIVGRSTTATRQLASRARRRVQGTATVPDADLADQRKVVDAFLTARGGDLSALLAVLDPDVVLSADATATRAGAPGETRGAPAVAKFFARKAQAAGAAFVNGAAGLVVAPRGRLLLALDVTISHGKNLAINAISDPQRLRRLNLAVL